MNKKMTKKNIVEKIHEGLDCVANTINKARTDKFRNYDVLNILNKISALRFELVKNYRNIPYEEASRLNERIRLCDTLVNDDLSIQSWRNLSSMETRMKKITKQKTI